MIVLPMANELGRRIRNARERRGWTQIDLANQVGVRARTIGAWERGENIPLNRLGKLEEIFGPEINPANDHSPDVARGKGVPPEIELMFAHYADLSAMDLVRLSRLIMDDALREGR